MEQFNSKSQEQASRERREVTEKEKLNTRHI